MNASYKRVRALFTDHLGLPRGKYIPAGLVQEGARFCIATYALTFDRTMTPEAEAGKLMEGLPDLDLEFDFGDIRRSWQPDTGIVIGDLHFHGN
ncbi:MAG: glutamine synthetase, partial [Chloroflexota bacterium]